MVDYSVTNCNPYDMCYDNEYCSPSVKGVCTKQCQNMPLYDFNSVDYNYQPDTVSFGANNQTQAETKKRRMSIGAIIAICAGVAIALAVGADFLFCKGRHVKSIFGKAGKKGGGAGKPSGKPANTTNPATSTPTNTHTTEKGATQVQSKTSTTPKLQETKPAPSRSLNNKGKTDVHERILNGEFGALESKSFEEVGRMYQDFAKTQGLHFEECGDSFIVSDSAGNMVREAHQGLFDGLWYDHHQVFNSNNKITNRFVLNHKGKLQSAVEFFYDEAGKFIRSVGYGGKAGKDIMVFGNDGSRTQLTLAEYVKKFGDIPKYYKEICS